MAGGIGSRLWPLSRSTYPKQFQSLINSNTGMSMLQQTIARMEGLLMKDAQVICNHDHRFLVAGQLQSMGKGGDIDVVLEPVGRNTAPAVLVAALRLLNKDVDNPMLLLAADHAISDVKAFHQALVKANQLACDGFIVTLGITPTFACTGYGYIRQGEKLSHGFVVDSFVEKPSLSIANEYLNSGNYLWNSGMFIAKPSVLVAEAAQYCPKLLEQCKNIVNKSYVDLDFIRLPNAEFAKCQNISIDYAIMERTSIAAVVPIDCGWSDVGDLLSLRDSNAPLADDQGNVLDGDVEAHLASGCFVKSEDKLVALVGVDNLAVVNTKDAVLVVNLDAAQEVKNIVRRLESRKELDYHREVYRPWGSYDSIDVGSNYQVKRISVSPGGKLSLQRHQYRAEHWVIVEGTATVHLNGEESILQANESIYIPRQAIHSLFNNTDEPLHLIEVQSGSYLGEDDIERLEDLYGRSVTGSL